MSGNYKKSTFGNISFGSTPTNVTYGNEISSSFGSSSLLNSSGSSRRLNSSGFSVSRNSGSSSIFRSPSASGTPFRPSDSSAFSPVSPVRPPVYRRTTHNSGSSMNTGPVLDPFYTPLASPSDSPLEETEYSTTTPETTSFFETTESTPPISLNIENLSLEGIVPPSQLNNILIAVANPNTTMGPQNPFNQPIIPLNYESRPTSTSSESSNLSTTGGFISYKRFLGK